MDSTASLYHFFNQTNVRREEDRKAQAALREHYSAQAERWQAEAAEVLAWVQSDEFSGSSEYVVNLKAVASGATVSDRNVTLLVSAIGAYRRHLGQVAEKAAAPERNDVFVGAVKDKVTVKDLTVVGVRLIDGNYSTTYLYTLLDGEGRTFKWFSSNDQGWDQGTTHLSFLTGTVKAHDEYQGRKATVLTRCKFEVA